MRVLLIDDDSATAHPRNRAPLQVQLVNTGALWNYLDAKTVDAKARVCA